MLVINTKGEINMSRQNNVYDAVVVGAGFAGLYMQYRLRELGLSIRGYEAGSGVGGTWHWNRYPGATTDSEAQYYCFSFSKELQQEWNWSNRYPYQQEVEQYLNYVADKFDLRRNIKFDTRVTSSVFNEESGLWEITTDKGDRVIAKYFISAIGHLSTPFKPKIKGIDNFHGKWYHTAEWPQEDVDFADKRVAVIGTGSSGVQCIPIIAQESAHLTVFQRTPEYVIPARNKPIDPEALNQMKATYDEVWKKVHEHWFGMAFDYPGRCAFDVNAEERERIYQAAWEKGGFSFLFDTFEDLIINKEANDTAAEFIRSKIKETVKDPKMADILTPKNYPFAAKRPIMDQLGYFETFNRDNVSLVDLKNEPIIEVTPTGIRTEDAEYEVDIIVFATGFDAVTGPLSKIDIRGKEGKVVKEKWENGPRTYLGLGINGFPNMFIITGPLSPFANIPVIVEKNVEWISDCIKYMRSHDIKYIEPTEDAENRWIQEVIEVAEQTLVTEGKKVNSWFTGANIPGKAQVVNVYFGGTVRYFQICDEVAEKNYDGFNLITGKDRTLTL
jgi:cation diffusion facilitator CzcD-associated flavoprotein CzcO